MPVDDRIGKKAREGKKEFPKSVKVVARPLIVEKYMPTVFFGLAINEKIDVDWKKWTSKQVIKTTDISFEYITDYAFKKGNNHIILINNVENQNAGWQCELFIDDKLVGKGIVTYKVPLKIDIVVTNKAMVPRKSLRNGFMRTKMVRGMQMNVKRKDGLIQRIKTTIRTGSK